MSFAFVFKHHFGNPLEACEYVVHLDVLLFGNRLDGFGSNDSLNNVFVALDESEFATTSHEVVKENHHNLVAVNQLIFALGVFDNNANAVGVWVGSHNDVGINFFSLCNSHSHSRSIFRVRRVDGREVAALHVLFRHVNHIGEAKVSQ